MTPGITELSEALGVDISTLQRQRRRGLTLPADGESTAAWVVRAQAWIAEHRQKSGPKALASKDPKADAVLLRWRKARAQLAELQLERERGLVHTKSECERAAIARMQELRAAFELLPAKLGSRLMHAPSPDFIQRVVEDELRHAFDRLARGGDEGEAIASESPTAG